MVLTRLPWKRLTSATETAEIVQALMSMSSVKRALPPKIGPVLTLGVGAIEKGLAPLWDSICRVFGCRTVVAKRGDRTSLVFVGSSEDITLAALACRKIAAKIGDHKGSAESLHMHIRGSFCAIPGYLTTTDAIRERIKAMGSVSGFVKPTWK